MTSPVQTPYLELQKQLWKARAQAKQKWLEQSLAQPTTTSDDAAWRTTWIKQALNMVKRGQADDQVSRSIDGRLCGAPERARNDVDRRSGTETQ